MANLSATCGNEGRLRKYYTWGFEPRMRMGHHLFGPRSEVAFGFRAHFETQDRQQQNGDRPLSRTGVLVENNERRNRAYSGFLQNQFQFGKLAVSPGIRLERVRYERTNRLANNGQGVSGDTNLTQWIPGIGVMYTPVSGLTLFTGIHRGFSPPRTEDIINNNTGGSIDLDAELSWNFEAGARARAHRLVTFEATYFRMDFENQIIPASVAGGTGANLTSAGQTLHQGAEFSGRADYRNIFGSHHSAYLRAAYTLLPVSEFRSMRFSGVSGFGGVSVSGNRLPYSPRYLLSATAGYLHSSGANALIESVYQSRQFADDLNSINVSPDGQRGAIPGATIFNATLNYPVEQWRTTLFITAKNLADRLYIVDRSRGILPSMPRMIQAGFRFAF
jgi:Fe(3+) dicitrate transport protein